MVPLPPPAESGAEAQYDVTDEAKGGGGGGGKRAVHEEQKGSEQRRARCRLMCWPDGPDPW